jgi:hypothetical protein
LWLLSQDHSVFFNDYIPMMDVITIIDDWFKNSKI